MRLYAYDFITNNRLAWQADRSLHMAMYEDLIMRNLPDVLQYKDGSKVSDKNEWSKRREEIAEIITREFTGASPAFPLEVKGEVVKTDENCYGGKAVKQTIHLQIKSPFSHFAFPFDLCVPKIVDKPPVFLNLSFTPVVGDGLGEEIIDHGFAIANVYYQDIAPDKEDNFYGGAGRFCTRNNYDSWGKVAMWAWGASRIMDYLLELDCIDHKRIGVAGHSRLGKTALVCGAFDERFSIVISNNSGGGGAALFRGKKGEGIADLKKGLARTWFCGNFYEYSHDTDALPFDQHYLLSLIAPRKLYVSSASMDEWADPISEYLACVAASPVYEVLGEKGLIHNNAYPNTEEVYHKGSIGYHLREGTHHMGRYDWNCIMEYRKLHNV